MKDFISGVMITAFIAIIGAFVSLMWNVAMVGAFDAPTLSFLHASCIMVMFMVAIVFVSVILLAVLSSFLQAQAKPLVIPAEDSTK